MGKKPSATLAIALLMLMAAVGAAQAAVDVEAAKELAKTNDRLKCHSADKDKKGPAMKKISTNTGASPMRRTRSSSTSPRDRPSPCPTAWKFDTKSSAPRILRNWQT